VDDARVELEAKYLHAFGDGAIIQGPESISAIERTSLVKMAACSYCPQKAFGYMNAEWMKFKDAMRTGDCVVFFRSDRTSWNELKGVEGYGLMRKGKLIVELIVSVS